MINDPSTPYCYSLTIVPGSTFNGANLITFSNYAIFTQIQNLGSGPVTVRLNGSSAAQFNLPANTTQIFNKGELVLSSIDFADTSSGASGFGNLSVDIIVGVIKG